LFFKKNIWPHNLDAQIDGLSGLSFGPALRYWGVSPSLRSWVDPWWVRPWRCSGGHNLDRVASYRGSGQICFDGGLRLLPLPSSRSPPEQLMWLCMFSIGVSFQKNLDLFGFDLLCFHFNNFWFVLFSVNFNNCIVFFQFQKKKTYALFYFCQLQNKSILL